MTTLTKHDSKLISAAIDYTLAVIEGGPSAARFVSRLNDHRITDATEALSGIELGVGKAQEGFGTFDQSLNRLQQIQAELRNLGDTDVAVLEPIDAEGKGTGPKQYQLWLTHDEIHLLHWAVELSEQGLVHSPMGMAKALAVYTRTRGELRVDDFVDKFNAVHEQARVNDGEGE